MDILTSLPYHFTKTYFWREPQVFEALSRRSSGACAQKRKMATNGIRIWSAGCASGEEPYSIAIALRRAIPDLKDWNITILATDINPRILRKAWPACTGKWSFRNAPQWLVEGYFRSKKGRGV